MTYEIIDIRGSVIGSWNCENIEDLIQFIEDYENRRAYIKIAMGYFERMRVSNELPEIDIRHLPSVDLGELLSHSSEYPILACDEKGYCLVGRYPYHVEHRNKILTHFIT